NRKVWIQVGDRAMEGPFLVTDVAGRHHIPALIRRGWVVDVDYETAQRWLMQGPIPVTIYDEPPADAVVVVPPQADTGPVEVVHDTAAAAEVLVASEAETQVATEPSANAPAAVAPSSE
ncbi:MAG: hypothetical protein H3C34_28170, partial [Caldilineaceae bacterium]|nr:hypothetical protein [Caldilineaceae bacterium]